MILCGCSGSNWPFCARLVPLLKPGGSLVYSTCSLEPEENEEVIEAFLRRAARFLPNEIRKTPALSRQHRWRFRGAIRTNVNPSPGETGLARRSSSAARPDLPARSRSTRSDYEHESGGRLGCIPASRWNDNALCKMPVSTSSLPFWSIIPPALKRNEKVLIETFDAPDEMTIALIRAARKAKAIPFVQMQRARVTPRARARDRWARSSI